MPAVHQEGGSVSRHNVIDVLLGIVLALVTQVEPELWQTICLLVWVFALGVTHRHVAYEPWKTEKV